ncbi:hypothetical protein ABBQ32_005097 [Trebouxia sp. C0010 RCD-2024]
MPTVENLKVKANAAYAEHKYADAVQLYSQALSLDPKNHVLLSNRSAAFAGLDQYKKALDDANACIQNNPEFVKGYSRQAYAYLKLNKPGFAERSYRRGLQLDPAYPALKQGLASILKEDGDQSSKSCRQKNDQVIRNSMARVGEMFPYHLAREPNQPLIKALCDFDLIKLQSIFQPEWLSYRATPNYLPITSLVVSLAQRTSAPKAEAIPKYVAILEWLIQEGARVDARDIGGYTALGHAAAHTPVLPLAEVLLRNGANVNYQNRFGAAVLMAAVMAAEDAAVSLLLKWGADCKLQDNDGVTPLDTARHFPEILAAMHQKQGTHAEGEQQYSHKCGQCGKPGAVKRCSKCRLSTYCSSQCQKEHWPAHKRECKQQAQKQLRVDVSSRPPGGSSWAGVSQGDVSRWAAGQINGTGRGMAPPQSRPMTGNVTVKHEKLFDVKIQVPKETAPSIPPELLSSLNISAEDAEAVKHSLPLPGLLDMMCYNQKRDFQCWIPRKQNDSEELAKLIRSSGLAGGLKAYFKAFVDQTTQQLVVVPTMLPAQPW